MSEVLLVSLVAVVVIQVSLQSDTPKIEPYRPPPRSNSAGGYSRGGSYERSGSGGRGGGYGDREGGFGGAGGGRERREREGFDDVPGMSFGRDARDLGSSYYIYMSSYYYICGLSAGLHLMTYYMCHVSSYYHICVLSAGLKPMTDVYMSSKYVCVLIL